MWRFSIIVLTCGISLRPYDDSAPHTCQVSDRPRTREVARQILDRKIRSDTWEVVSKQYVKHIKDCGNWEHAKLHANAGSMWMFVVFREAYVNKLLKDLHDNQHLDAVPPAIVPGSKNIYSDYDVSISVPNALHFSSKVVVSMSVMHDVVLAHKFVEQVEQDFGRPPGHALDTNVYVDAFPMLFGDCFQGTVAKCSTPQPLLWLDTLAQDVAVWMKLLKYLDAQSLDHLLALFHSESADFLATFQRASRNYFFYTSAVEHAVSERKLITDEDAAKLFGRIPEVPTVDSIPEYIKSQKEAADKLRQDGRKRHSDEYEDWKLRIEYDLYLKGHKFVRSQLETLRGGDRNLMTNFRFTMANTLMPTILVAAPEAYYTEGAFLHVVQIMQGGNADADAAKTIMNPFRFLCSLNEQAADFFKEVNFHHRADPDVAAYQGSKYLKRFYNASIFLFDAAGPALQRDLDVGVGTDSGFVKYILGLSKTVGKLVQIRADNNIAAVEKKRRSSLNMLSEGIKHSFCESVCGTAEDVLSSMKTTLVRQVALINRAARRHYPMGPSYQESILAYYQLDR